MDIDQRIIQYFKQICTLKNPEILLHKSMQVYVASCLRECFNKDIETNQLLNVGHVLLPLGEWGTDNLLLGSSTYF